MSQDLNSDYSSLVAHLTTNLKVLILSRIQQKDVYLPGVFVVANATHVISYCRMGIFFRGILKALQETIYTIFSITVESIKKM